MMEKQEKNCLKTDRDSDHDKVEKEQKPLLTD